MSDGQRSPNANILRTNLGPFVSPTVYSSLPNSFGHLSIAFCGCTHKWYSWYLRNSVCILQVKGNAVFPAAGMLETALAAGITLLSDERIAPFMALAAIVIPAPLLLTPSKVCDV